MNRGGRLILPPQNLVFNNDFRHSSTWIDNDTAIDFKNESFGRYMTYNVQPAVSLTVSNTGVYSFIIFVSHIYGGCNISIYSYGYVSTAYSGSFSSNYSVFTNITSSNDVNNGWFKITAPSHTWVSVGLLAF